MNETTTTWRAEISKEMGRCGDHWVHCVASTLTDEELDAVFDAGWGSAEGKPFTLHTVTRVYFPAVYDGSEWCASVSRNPDGVPTEHIGG